MGAKRKVAYIGSARQSQANWQILMKFFYFVRCLVDKTGRHGIEYNQST